MNDETKLMVTSGTLHESSLLKRMQEVEDAIAHRAYQLFASRGFTDGRDVDDWLAAESELFRPLPLNLSETENGLTLKVELPGFTEKDIKLRVEPHCVFITGEREENVENKEEGKVVSSEHRSNQLFRAIDLPAEVDPDKVRATLDKGILEVVLTKREEGNGVTIVKKAA